MSAIMFNHRLLVLLTALGSALCWLPIAIQPRLGLPFWTPLACAALCTSASTILESSRWLSFLAASGAGTFGGLCLSIAIWWPSDPLAASLIPFVVVVSTLAALLVSLIAGWVARKLFAPNRTPSNRKFRSAAWVLLVGVAAFGPAALAITRPVVARRMANDDRLAAERFASLKAAVERTEAEGTGPNRLCDGTKIEHNYSGPPFSDEDWSRIAGNYVKQAGYLFMRLLPREERLHDRRATGSRTRQRCPSILYGRVGQSGLWDGMGPFTAPVLAVLEELRLQVLVVAPRFGQQKWSSLRSWAALKTKALTVRAWYVGFLDFIPQRAFRGVMGTGSVR
jgi:hypothetical protein